MFNDDQGTPGQRRQVGPRCMRFPCPPLAGSRDCCHGDLMGQVGWNRGSWPAHTEASSSLRPTGPAASSSSIPVTRQWTSCCWEGLGPGAGRGGRRPHPRIYDQEQLVPGSHRHLCPDHGAGGDPGTTPIPGHREVDGHATGKSWSRQEVPISIGDQTVAGVSFFIIWEDEEACDI